MNRYIKIMMANGFLISFNPLELKYKKIWGLDPPPQNYASGKSYVDEAYSNSNNAEDPEHRD